MLVRNRSNGAVITEGDFRRDYPNTSFPRRLSPELLDAFGFDPVLDGPQPTGEAWQHAVHDGVEEINGQWFTKWTLGPVFDTPEDEAAYIAEWQLSNVTVSTPRLIASGVFTVTDGFVESIGTASGIAMVFAIDIGTYWLFFTEPQADLSYAAYVSSSSGQINVSGRSTEYLELCVKDGGVLSDPSEFSINIVRTS